MKPASNGFVHLSSFGIHGNAITGVIDESTRIRPPRGDRYCESKAMSERVVLQACRRGLPGVVLRPTNVYGPFSKTFVQRPIDYLLREKLVLAGSSQMPSNTVHVDNLVASILCAIEAPRSVCGEVFLISEGDEYTWSEFFGFFAEALGQRVRTAEMPPTRERRAWPGRSAVDWMSQWNQGLRGIVTSSEFRALGAKVLYTDPIGRWPRQILQRSPRFKNWLGRRLGMQQATIYRRGTSSDDDVFYFRSRPATTSIAKAQRDLGYRPEISREVGMQRTLDWLRHAGLV